MALKYRTPLVLVILICGVICGIIVGGIIALTSDLPQIRSLETYKPASVTRIFSADKVLLTELFAERRDPVSFRVVPDYLKIALISTEDRHFYEHSGVDLKGILRAVIRNIWAAEYAEGASTITQQLAKTLFLSSKKTLTRKIKEAFLSFQLERRYTKDEILAFYLNQVYFGSGAYGVESAARIYFGKSVEDLNLPECALIAGLPKAPSRYSPLVNKSLAIQRRNTVLAQMKKTGSISESEYQEALDEPVDVTRAKRVFVKAPYFIEYIKRSLETILGTNRLYKGGLSVQTTLNHRLQTISEKAVLKGLTDLEKRMKQRKMSTSKLQGALIALDVTNGGIQAMVGGKDFYESPFNRATSTNRQAGSAFKPVVFALAIERGFAQNRLILDAPVVFKGAREGQDWRPENFSKTFQGEMTLRRALVISENIPAVRLIEMLGASSVAQFGHRLGIRSPLTANLTLALGTSGVSILELTAAYAVFPNRGQWIEPYGIVEIVDRSGRIIWQVKPKKKIVMSRAGAAIMTDMLQAVINEGTGKKASGTGRPLAGKTGTTNDFKDALFVGFSPNIAVGVWVGQDTYVSLGNRETGARAALPIWIEFMKGAMDGSPPGYFDIPDDVVSVRIDSRTGLPASENTPHSVMALFKKGTEPNR